MAIQMAGMAASAARVVPAVVAGLLAILAIFVLFAMMPLALMRIFGSYNSEFLDPMLVFDLGLLLALLIALKLLWGRVDSAWQNSIKGLAFALSAVLLTPFLLAGALFGAVFIPGLSGSMVAIIFVVGLIAFVIWLGYGMMRASTGMPMERLKLIESFALSKGFTKSLRPQRGVIAFSGIYRGCRIGIGIFSTEARGRYDFAPAWQHLFVYAVKKAEPAGAGSEGLANKKFKSVEERLNLLGAGLSGGLLVQTSFSSLGLPVQSRDVTLRQGEGIVYLQKTMPQAGVGLDSRLLEDLLDLAISKPLLPAGFSLPSPISSGRQPQKESSPA